MVLKGSAAPMALLGQEDVQKVLADLVAGAKKKLPAPQPNQVIELTCEKCVLCGSPEIKAGRKVRQRRLTDRLAELLGR